MLHRVLSTSALLVTLCAGVSANAQTNAGRSPWMAAVEVTPQWHHDASYATFLRRNESVPTVGLVLGRDLAHITPTLTLAAELGWRMENTAGYVRQTYDTRLITHQLQAGVTLRLDRWSWFTPYARLSGGAQYLNARINETLGSSTLQGDAWVPWGGLGAGVLLTGGRWFEGLGAHTLRLMLAVEGGYQLVMSTEVRVAIPAPSDDAAAADRINAQSTSLGTLNPSAAYMRVVLGFRF